MSDKKIDMERYLKGILAQKGGGLFILIDPDRGSPLELAKLAALSAELGADAILIGSSILLNDDLSETVRSIKSTTGIPVFLFPGNGQQITPGVDGILFLSLISGRNPRWLIEEQVEAAPRIKAMGIPVLPTGYMIIESGRVTAVEFMSGTVPIPRDKPDIAAAHAIAAGMLGMKALFLEAGSGAEKSVPPEMVAAVKRASDLPLIVGGGIREIGQAEKIASAGADFIVIGNAIEKTGNTGFISEIASIIHRK